MFEEELDSDLFDANEGLQIAPLIDVVFLLLIYFMVTSSLKKAEADLGITLPGTVKQSSVVEMPDEQIIDIGATGAVILNNTSFGQQGSRELPRLEARLTRYRQACAAAGNKALITIQPEDRTKQQRVIDVMNACAGAEIRHVTFGMGD